MHIDERPKSVYIRLEIVPCVIKCRLTLPAALYGVFRLEALNYIPSEKMQYNDAQTGVSLGI